MTGVPTAALRCCHCWITVAVCSINAAEARQAVFVLDGGPGLFDLPDQGAFLTVFDVIPHKAICHFDR